MAQAAVATAADNDVRRLAQAIVDSQSSELLGYDEAELIRGPARTGPWRTVEDVELATLGWVHWHNTEGLHGYPGDIPLTEFETAFYATHGSDQALVEIP